MTADERTRRLERRRTGAAATGLPSWARLTPVEDEARAYRVLRRLEHHARTFPAPLDLDTPVARAAALELLEGIIVR